MHLGLELKKFNWSKASKAYYLRNRTQITEKRKQYRVHKQLSLFTYKMLRAMTYDKHRRNNLAKFAEKSRRWRAANPEKLKAFSKKARIKHSAKVKANRLKRKHKIRIATNEDPSLISNFINRLHSKGVSKCYYCKTPIKSKLAHLDHVTAINLGGLHSITNLCVSCPRCNLTKHDKPLSRVVVKGQSFLSL